MRLSVDDLFAKELPPGVRRWEALRELFSTHHAVSIHSGLNDPTCGSDNVELLALLAPTPPRAESYQPRAGADCG